MGKRIPNAFGSGADAGLERRLSPPMRKAYDPHGCIAFSCACGIYLSHPDGWSEQIYDCCGQVNNLRFSPDGSLLAFTRTFYEDWEYKTNLEIIDFEVGRKEPLHSWEIEPRSKYWWAGPPQLSFSPDGKKVMCSNDHGTIFVCELKKSTPMKFKDPQLCDYQVPAVFSPDGRFIAYGGADALSNETWIKVVDDSFNCVYGDRFYPQYNDAFYVNDVTHIDFSPDGKRIVVAGAELSPDGRFRGAKRDAILHGQNYLTVFKTKGIRFEKSIHPYDEIEKAASDSEAHIYKVRFSPDGNMLGIGTCQGTYLIDLDGKPLHEFPREPVIHRFADLDFSPNGSYFTYCSGERACIFDMKAEVLRAGWSIGNCTHRSVAYCPV